MSFRGQGLYGNATMEPVEFCGGAKPPASSKPSGSSKGGKSSKPGWQEAQEQFEKMINGADDDRPFVPKDEGPKVPDKVDYEVRGAKMDDARKEHDELRDSRKKLADDALRAKRYGDAAELYDFALDVAPNDSVLLSNKSAALLLHGDAAGALAAADASIAANRKWAKARGRRVAALHALKRYDEAVTSAEQALFDFPTDEGGAIAAARDRAAAARATDPDAVAGPAPEKVKKKKKKKVSDKCNVLLTYNEPKNAARRSTLKLGLKRSWLAKDVGALVKTFVDHYNGGRPFDEHLAVAELRVEGAGGDHVPTSMALEDVVSEGTELFVKRWKAADPAADPDAYAAKPAAPKPKPRAAKPAPKPREARPAEDDAVTYARDAEDLRAAGAALAADGNDFAAAEKYEAAAGKEPSPAGKAALLAAASSCLARLGRGSRAVDAAVYGLKLCPSSFVCRVAEADAFLATARAYARALDYTGQRAAARAVAAGAPALRAKPKVLATLERVHGYLEEADALVDLKDAEYVDRAIDLYSKVLKLDAEHAVAYERRAACELELAKLDPPRYPGRWSDADPGEEGRKARCERVENDAGLALALMEPFPAVLLLRGDALRLLGRHDAAVDDYGDYVEIMRRRGFDVRRHPQMRVANDMWGKLLSAGHKSMRRQHNPRAQKFDWTGNRWRQWYDAEPDFHGPNDGYTYDAHRERSGHAGHRAEYADMAADEDLDAHYWPTKSHYEVLGVSPDAADAAIKKAYFAKARECHPDKNRDDPDATAKFERIALSYSVLIDPLERCYYDEARTARRR
ncbi:hypothetical protein AURANDRAFT_63757 [Aureococcus anophagefferens]|uniref:J domain-containing protein n=1 Tax=Aureococcus anophagefferens TaxID=44056 RepID=F0Y7P5_AURAN|nr:hypothetical protein AURANDRAFT_63757 [Aureococcus anophagefferens]EGB08854.1 hypothetical protein AURANDRAFT_63757 [Aureococcus anophagefferens]|eukprot:XP_009036831.1 hypothetical protein AURANDRAFT_63757 [Aureococcus anophagefferens]